MECSDDCPRPTLPDEMPVMVLPDCHLFPGCLLPLYIYEERYRKMLAHALDSNRMFCIGNREGEGEDAPISTHSTAGLVRACVRQKDGTSHLLLLGLQRIKLGDWVQTKPFRVARIEPLETVTGDPDEQQRLKNEALGLFSAASEQAKELRKVLEENDDAEMVCDVLSYHFTRCPKLQQRLMGEPSLVKRYEMVIEALKKTDCK
jgi:Lon protease-like protein